MIIAWILHDYSKFYQLPNSNLFTHRLLFFSREATSETYGPRVSFHHICFCDLFSLAFIFRSIKPKNTKIPCCNLFVLRSIYPIYHFHLMLFAYLEAPYPEGIDNPFNMSGCEDLWSVCRGCLRCVAWFSYWFDNLGLISEGNTYRCCAASSIPLSGNTDVLQAASVLPPFQNSRWLNFVLTLKRREYKSSVG